MHVVLGTLHQRNPFRRPNSAARRVSGCHSIDLTDGRDGDPEMRELYNTPRSLHVQGTGLCCPHRRD